VTVLSLDRLAWRMAPYPIGCATDVFAAEAYAALVAAYPDEKVFARMGQGYEKLSLSERNHPQQYVQVLTTVPMWMAFYRYIKSPDFLLTVHRALKAHGLSVLRAGRFTSRFEFSSMPGDGGLIAPHTDIPSKVVTLIVPMMAAGDWDPAWGGGTDVLVPQPGVEPVDYQTPRAQFDLAHSYPCTPNQAVVFLKSAHSWHSVGPIQGPPGTWRRTVTINIERVA